MNESTAVSAVQTCVRRCRRVARTALVVVTLFWIVFGIATGAQGEGGIGALFQNYTNLLPLLAIFVLWFVAWKWEIPGGILIIAFSIFMAVRLGAFSDKSTESLMIITPMAMTGFMFIFIGFRIWAAKNLDASQKSQD